MTLDEHINPLTAVLPLLKTEANKTKYKVGDPIESVAYRQGQLDFIEFIEDKIMHMKKRPPLPTRKP